MAAVGTTVTPHSILAIGIVMPTVAGVAVGSRIWMRLSMKMPLLEHDYLILAAYIVLFASGVLLIYGGASHTLATVLSQSDESDGYLHVETPELVVTEKIKFVVNLIVNPAIGLVKLSVLTWYRRLFRGRAFNAITIILMVIVSLWIVTVFFVFLFQCGTNFDALWGSLYDLQTRCNNFERFRQYDTQIMAIPDFVTDVATMAIPVPFIVRLKMGTAKKLGLCLVFLLGAFACAAALTRLLIYQDSLEDTFKDSQIIKVLSVWMFWSVLELGVSITAACLPILTALFRSARFQKFADSLRTLSMKVSSLPGIRNIKSRRTSVNQMGMSQGFSKIDDRGDSPSHELVGFVDTPVVSEAHSDIMGNNTGGSRAITKSGAMDNSNGILQS